MVAHPFEVFGGTRSIQFRRSPPPPPEGACSYKHKSGRRHEKQLTTYVHHVAAAPTAINLLYTF